MPPEPREVIEFLQALAAGAVVLDRADRAHVERLEAACALLEELQALSQAVPELQQSGLGLTRIEDTIVAEGEGLSAKIGVLEGLREALEQHIGGMRRRAQAGPAAPEPAPWADPAAPAYDGVVAVDVGTSHVACAHWSLAGGDPEVGAVEPAAVNVLDARGFRRLAPGSFLVGQAALDHRTGVNLYRSFRRLLGRQPTARPAATGKELVQVPVRLLVAAMLDAQLRALTLRLGHERLRFPRVVVTVPASGDLALEHELRALLRELELPVTTELDEATAACVYHLLRPVLLQELGQVRPDGTTVTPGEWYAEHLGVPATPGARPGSLSLDATVLCVDCGGGGTDLSLLEFQLQQDAGGCQVHIEVQDTTGFPDLSGEGLTLHVFDLLKRRLALAVAAPRRALTGVDDGAPPGAHPWRELHRREAGAPDPGLDARLDEELGLVLRAWDQVAGERPLPAPLRAAVDRLFPTVTRGVPAGGKRLRSANFRWLWQEAERLGQQVAAERAALLAVDRDLDDPIPAVRGRLDLATYPVDPLGVDLLARLASAGVDPARPPHAGALQVSSRDVDAWVERQAAAPLRTALEGLCGARPVHRVLLAGGGTHAARVVLERVVRQTLHLSAAQVVFDPTEAKRAVAKGACLWAIGSRLEGIEVFLTRAPRSPARLWLLSAVQNEVLFEEGQAIDRFSFVQPAHREGAEGDKLVLIGREQGGRLEPFLMFDPAKGTPVPDVAELPIMRRRDVVVRNVDRFLGFNVRGALHEFHVADPNGYVQVEETLVPQWELFEALRREMTMEEVIAWLEGAAHLQAPPPSDHAFHRYYMDETRQLYLVFHTRAKKVLCRAQVMKQGRHHLPEELDPFSGVH
ncbi:MAG: hypothetical protein M9894_33590 [Planctomycetes bacterium]|nr:hypothetical protein [Planctomycetota bacterium]